RTSPRTTSSRASSTAKSPPRSPRRSSRRRSARASPASTRRPGPSRRWRPERSVKVLVTGASGFIGSALCDSLLVRGDSVVGRTRAPGRARRTTPAVVWHPWEPTLERPPAEAFGGVDGVVNLVGERIDQRWTEEAKQRILESRRTATRNLIGAIAGL